MTTSEQWQREVERLRAENQRLVREYADYIGAAKAAVGDMYSGQNLAEGIRELRRKLEDARDERDNWRLAREGNSRQLEQERNSPSTITCIKKGRSWSYIQEDGLCQ